MTTEQLSLIAQALDEIRIDPELAEHLVQAAIAEIDRDQLAARLDETDFLVGAIRTAQEVMTMTTLAQSMAADAPFTDALKMRTFAGGDDGLQAIGECILGFIRSEPRLPDPEISDSLLDSRYDAIRTAI